MKNVLAKVTDSGAKQFGNSARRLWRIFAHAYHHHQIKFIQLESETYLCNRFVLFIKSFPIANLSKEAQVPPEILEQIRNNILP